MPVLRKFKSRRFICVHLCSSVAVADPYLCSSVASGHLWLSLDQTHAPRFPPFTGRTPTRLQSCDRQSPPRLAGGGRGEMASRKGVSVEWRMAGGQRSTAPIQRIERPLTKTCPAESAVIRVNPWLEIESVDVARGEDERRAEDDLVSAYLDGAEPAGVETGRA